MILYSSFRKMERVAALFKKLSSISEIDGYLVITQLLVFVELHHPHRIISAC
jgi:hypothetical protein